MRRWTVEFDSRAARELRRIDHQHRSRILRFLRERVAIAENPRRIGSALTGQAIQLWRYRVGEYRLICTIEDERLVVLVVRVGHRRRIYDR
ncbi:MAG: type II toxin-antitoxin system RelE/ParE family toxin [Thermoanaerobaculia bacterium]|nr:type II toxin-antitoxin system RelE/ParE family toxin [Thermoanaerobaculia bacterium]